MVALGIVHLYSPRCLFLVSLKKPLMPRHQWNSLNTQQIGAYAEYFVKMELTMHGFQVYSTEVDDRGIDFVARRESGPFIEVQVKSLRSMGYVFMQKTKFPPEAAHVLGVVPLCRWTGAKSVPYPVCCVAYSECDLRRSKVRCSRSDQQA